MRFDKSIFASATVITTLLVSTVVLAQGGLSLPWWRSSSGGAVSSGGGYTLSGTLGQAEAGIVSGGGYSLAGGFWGAAEPGQLVGPASQIYAPVANKNPPTPIVTQGPTATATATPRSPTPTPQPQPCGDDEPNNMPEDVEKPGREKPLRVIGAWCTGVLEVKAKGNTYDFYKLDLASGTVVTGVDLQTSSADIGSDLIEKQGPGIYVSVTTKLPYTLKPGLSYFVRAKSLKALPAQVNYLFRVRKQ